MSARLRGPSLVTFVAADTDGDAGALVVLDVDDPPQAARTETAAAATNPTTAIRTFSRPSNTDLTLRRSLSHSGRHTCRERRDFDEGTIKLVGDGVPRTKVKRSGASPRSWTGREPLSLMPAFSWRPADAVTLGGVRKDLAKHRPATMPSPMSQARDMNSATVNASGE